MFRLCLNLVFHLTFKLRTNNWENRDYCSGPQTTFSVNPQHTCPISGTGKFTSSEQAVRGLARSWHIQMTWNGTLAFLTSYCRAPANYLTWLQKPCEESCHIGRGPMELTSCSSPVRSCTPPFPFVGSAIWLAVRQFLQRREPMKFGFGSPKVSVKQKHSGR